MRRFVLDTNIIIAAMHSPTGASAALLGAALDKQILMFASVPLFVEYEAKCMDPLQWTAAGLTKQQASIFVKGLAALVKPVKIHFLWRPLLKDPCDEMVLEAAAHGRAEAIVTFNLRDYGDAPKKFHIETLLPAIALKRIQT